MDILESAAKGFEKLLNVNYELVLGRKGKTAVVNLAFHKEDFYHLAGLQYLVDIQQLKASRSSVFDRICNDDKFRNIILNSKVIDKVINRIRYLAKLENVLDSNDTVFKLYQLNFSKIKADYILVNELEFFKVYVFVKHLEDNNFICNSFFPNSDTDYVANQLKTTILFKKKNFIDNPDASIVFVDKLTPNKI